MCNYPSLDLVNTNAFLKFGEILSFCSQDIEQKGNYDRGNGRQPKSSVPSLFQRGAIIGIYMSQQTIDMKYQVLLVPQIIVKALTVN